MRPSRWWLALLALVTAACLSGCGKGGGSVEVATAKQSNNPAPTKLNTKATAD